MEWLLELLFEYGLQLFGDVIVDGLARTRNPVVRTLGYCVFCAVFAGVLAATSLALFGGHFVSGPSLRVAMLGVMPFLNGFIMVRFGRYLSGKGKDRSAYEYFAPAFVFSAVFGLVRYLGAH